MSNHSAHPKNIFCNKDLELMNNYFVMISFHKWATHVLYKNYDAAS